MARISFPLIVLIVTNDRKYIAQLLHYNNTMDFVWMHCCIGIIAVLLLDTNVNREVIVVFFLAPITILERPTNTDPLLVGEIAMFTITVRSVPAPEVTWLQQILPVSPLPLVLVPNGDSINITLQNLNSTTYMTVLFLRVLEILPGAKIETYAVLFHNGFKTIGDGGLLIRAGNL